MCGIFAICQQTCSDPACPRFSVARAQELSILQRHRGPDFRGSYIDEKTGDILCHERLAIMDLGISHPIQGEKKDHQQTISLDKLYFEVIHNGEIYNHQLLRDGELKGMSLRTRCDSEVIIYMYQKHRSGAICNMLDGIFAFALCYEGEFLAARDPIGVKPLYYGKDKDGRYFFSNEMKSIEGVCGDIDLAAFPPGHFWQPGTGFVRYYQPLWFDYRLATVPSDLKLLHDTFVKAVHKRLMSDAPLGILLSGGLDSSLVSSIAAREMQRQGFEIHSFSIGMDSESPDVKAARLVAKHINSIHHEVHFTAEDGIKNLEKLIWHLETYDVTSIRASTPMFFLSEFINKMGIKVVLSGEGADEIFGGYLYFHNAPSDDDFQKETIERVCNLSTADCLRADKSTMAHSLEVRVPFLDKAFLDVAMLTDVKVKRPHPKNGRYVEKHLLRQAFDHDAQPYLPAEILWRQKEQFSDGVGYAWIDTLMEHCAQQISDEEFAKADEFYPINTPHSKEAFYMRKIFAKHFPSESAAKTVRKWIPKWQKSIDPSGRASTVHDNSLHKEEKMPPIKMEMSRPQYA